MPDDTTASTTPAAATTDEASGPTTGDAAPAPTAPATPEEPRYAAGPNVPDWLVGKTMSEGAELTKQLYQRLTEQQHSRTVDLTSNYGQQAQQNPIDWGTDPNAAAQRVMQQQIAPALETRDNMLGAQARALAELQYKDDFRRWGPEIDMALSAIAPAQRTPQVVAWIVNGVRGQHMNELAEEAAQAKIQRLVQGGQLRPTGPGDATGAGADNRIDFDKLPPNYSQVLRNLRVTQETVDEMLRSCYPGMPLTKAREKWFTAATKGDIIVDGQGSYNWERPDLNKQ